VKGIETCILILFFSCLSVIGQAGINDYLLQVIDFTEKNQNQEAIKLCNKLVKLYPDNPDVYFLRGINHYIIAEYEDAINDFDQTLEIDSEYPDAYLYRAKSKKSNKNYWSALRDYNKAKNENFSQTVTSLAGDAIRSIFGSKKE